MKLHINVIVGHVTYEDFKREKPEIFDAIWDTDNIDFTFAQGVSEYLGAGFGYINRILFKRETKFKSNKDFTFNIYANDCRFVLNKHESFFRLSIWKLMYDEEKGKDQGVNIHTLDSKMNTEKYTANQTALMEDKDPTIQWMVNFFKNIVLVDVENDRFYTNFKFMVKDETWWAQMIAQNKEIANEIFQADDIRVLIDTPNSFIFTTKDGKDTVGADMAHIINSPFRDQFIAVGAFTASKLMGGANVIFFGSNTCMLPADDCLQMIDVNSTFFICSREASFDEEEKNREAEE